MDVLLPDQTNPTLNLGTVTPEDNGRKFKLVVSNGVLPNLTKTVTINVQKWHPDTANYLTRVEAADGQALEPAIAEAWDVFFRAMDNTDHPTPTAATHKAALLEGSMIPMLGARTLATSLLPLYPDMPSPTNVGLVTGDYDRVLGIQFDGSTKYIDLGVESGDLPQDDVSQGLYVTEEASAGIRTLIGFGNGTVTGATRIARHSSVSTTMAVRCRNTSTGNATNRMGVGTVAIGRVDSTEYYAYGNGDTSTLSGVSETPTAGIPVLVGAAGMSGSPVDYSDHRSTIAWHCLSVDLDYMDSCITTLQSSIEDALRPAVPVVTGDPYQGQTLTSTAAGQWYINDVAVSGETGGTFVVPETVLLGGKIRCGDSIALEVIRIPGSWGVRVDTTRTTAKTTDSDQFHMMGRSGVDETITIYWGDGTKSVCDTWDHADRIHTYADEGEYNVQVVGVTTANFSYFESLSDLPKIVSIDQWGNPWGATQDSAFFSETSPNTLNSLPDDAGHGLDTLVSATDMFRNNNLTTLPDDMTLDSLVNGVRMFFGNNLTALPDGMTLDSLTLGADMLRNNNNLTTLPEGMTLASLSNGVRMFLGNTINTEDYSGLLIRMEAANPNSNVSFNGGNSKYNPAAAVARDELVNRGWTITDGGPE